MTNPLTIGYIGLDIMGKSIARNILKAGFPLVVHNRSRGAVNELIAEGAQAAFSLAEVAAQVEVVFTNLPDSPRASNHVGLFSEHFIPSTNTQCGNFPQAYSHVGMINPAFAVSPPWSDVL